MAKLEGSEEELKSLISKRIKFLREQTGSKQSEFATRFDIDRPTLNRWEGGHGVTIYTINKFCKILGISLKDFFDDGIFS